LSRLLLRNTELFPLHPVQATAQTQASTALVCGAPQMIKVACGPIAPSCGFTIFLAGGLDNDHGMSEARRAHWENY